MTTIPNVILFSGGRTSGYMLRRLLDSTNAQEVFKSQRENPVQIPEWIVIFCNTGKERLETLDFVHEVETRWNVPVVWLEYHRVPAASITPGVFPTDRRNANLAKAAAVGETTHWFKKVDYETASRNGEPFDEVLSWVSTLPNPKGRTCSAELKIRTATRYLFSLGSKEYFNTIGIRKDEEPRATQILATCEWFLHPKFPLVEWGITESDVMRFWSKSDFDLQLESYEGNCDLCFLKAKWKRLRLIKENPGMVDWWKNWESKHKSNVNPGDGNVFRKGEPYALLEQIALEQAKQDEFCFTATDKDIPCSCAERAFGSDDEP